MTSVAASPRRRPAGHRAVDALLPFERELEAPPEGLDFLLQLLQTYLVEERPRIMEHNIQVKMDRPAGGAARGAVPSSTRPSGSSAANTGLRVCLAINYGGRAEIVDAVRRIAGEVRGALDPRPSTKTDLRSPLHRRHARSRPADSHRRRDADQQFPALADRYAEI